MLGARRGAGEGKGGVVEGRGTAGPGEGEGGDIVNQFYSWQPGSHQHADAFLPGVSSERGVISMQMLICQGCQVRGESSACRCFLARVVQ